ncbi:MAG TPA: DivIVA domain-containing protein [Acidimicrobiia bacterium]|nr:DivIVA domain-containing protein [Acidimicrobiia bacterium]
MDVSPQELRDTDIREGFRGYHRDDVDELLERAATTIEGLSERVRQITERIAEAETSGSRNRETEDTLQRTLVLAQRTADEAIADAQKRARKLLEEAETKSRTLVTESEATARRIAEDERRRMETDVRDLAARRDKLKTDVDALEKFEAEYRDRIRTTLQGELDSLGHSATEGASRPTLHEVEVPAGEPEQVARVRPAPSPPPAAAPAPPVMPDVPFPDKTPAPAEAAEWSGSSSAAPSDGAAADEAAESGMAAFVADEPIEAEVLDDDAFFASLREAVRDEDAPLSLQEDATSENFFDDEEEGSGKRRFRRRR